VSKPGYATILTTQGYLTMQQASELGPIMVVTPDGPPAVGIVTATGKTEEITIAHVTNGMEVYGTANQNHRTTGQLPAPMRELKEGTEFETFMTPVNGITTTNKKDYEAGILAGWIFADGWVSYRKGSGYRSGLCVGINEFDFIPEMERLLETKMRPHSQKPDTCKVVTVPVRKLPAKPALMQNKDDLDWLYLTTPSFKLGFLRAAFTADGSVRDQNNVQLYSVKLGALEVLSNILREFGIHNTISYHSHEKKRRMNDGTIRIDQALFKINVFAGQWKRVGFLTKYKNDLLEKHEERPIVRNRDYHKVKTIETEQEPYPTYALKSTAAFYIDASFIARTQNITD
jgi:hypothetical protein